VQFGEELPIGSALEKIPNEVVDLYREKTLKNWGSAL